MTYVRIGLRRSGKLLQTIFCLCKYSFLPFRLFLPLRQCPFLMRGLLRKSCTPGLSRLLPPPARLLCSERGVGASGRSFGARELASVSSVHLWTGGPGVALLRRNHASRFVSVGSPSSSLHALRGDGVGGSSEAHYSRLPLPPHLCMPCEVMRRESLRRPAPVRVPPRLPDLRLGKLGRSIEPALGRMALVTGLVAHAVSPLSVHG